MSEGSTDASRIETQVQQVVRALSDRGTPPVATDELERVVRARVADWQGVSVQAFVPLFVERHVREEFGARARG
jgi:hypothetical protein